MRPVLLRSLATCFLALALTPAARPEIFTAAIGSLHSVCSDADGSRHPRRLELTHLVPGPFDASQVLLTYDSNHESSGRSGKVAAEVVRKAADGDEERLGKVSASADEVTGLAEGAAAVDVRLAGEDLVLWRLSFRRFAPLPRDKCFTLIVAAIGSDSGGEESE